MLPVLLMELGDDGHLIDLGEIELELDESRTASQYSDE